MPSSKPAAFRPAERLMVIERPEDDDFTSSELFDSSVMVMTTPITSADELTLLSWNYAYEWSLWRAERASPLLPFGPLAPVDWPGNHYGAEVPRWLSPDGCRLYSSHPSGLNPHVSERLSQCGSVGVELATNGAHCGYCNHSCGGGSCDHGQCSAVQVAAWKDARPSIFSPDMTEFFDRQGGQVTRVSVPSGAVQVVVATANVGEMAVDNYYVYFLSDGGVGRVPRRGGTVVTLANVSPATTGLRPGLAIDGEYVYWLDDLREPPVGEWMAQRISRVGKLGGVPEVLA